MHDRRRLALGVAAVAALAIVLSPLAGSIVRGPRFHEYGGPPWLLVASNLPFVVVALLARGAPWPLRVGVATIGLGSGLYHAAPGDLTLALDWAPIASTLLMLISTIMEGGHLVALALALGTVGFWYATGGTTAGGNMLPYVLAQGAGVVLPPLLALLVPGRARLGWLLAGLGGFVLARLANQYDHSLKHLLAAGAAWCALVATTDRSSSSP